MIRKNAYGLSPNLDIAISGVPVDYMALNEVELFLEVNLHDMLVLTMAGLPTRAILEYRNRPVRCVIDLGAGYVQEFTGYVIDVRPTAVTANGLLNGHPFQDVKIVCLGASYQMRSGSSKVWQDRPLQDVASEFSNVYRFSTDVPADHLVLSPMIQDNESDWQFIVRYASLMGFETTMHGTHLHIFDPYKAFTRASSFNRLRSPKNLANNLASQPGQIASFKASFSERHADGKYMDTVITVHQDDNTIYDVYLRNLRGLTAPARFNNRLQESVDTYEQAIRAIEVESKSTYDYNAEIVVSGLPGCIPGGLVEVDSYDSPETDGLWYVKSIHHSVTSGVFTSTLNVAKNVDSELVASAVQPFTAPPAPKLINGEWIASQRKVNAYT
jgi:phage protein D